MAASTSAPNGALYFPSKDAIMTYLSNHPSTSDTYSKERNIMEAVAAFFANTTKFQDRVKTNVVMAIGMHDLDENLQLPESCIMALSLNVTQALEDCANGKEIQLQKIESKTNT